jgi:hypothetical protein
VGRRVAGVLQPNYLPWLGNFDFMDQVDVWVWLDTAQYTKNDWRNRNQISTPSGEPFWLTLPVLTRGRFGQSIAEASLDPRQDWGKRHLRSLEQAYSSAPHGAQVLEILRPFLELDTPLLADVTIPSCEALAVALGCETEFVRASALEAQEEDPTLSVIAICEEVGADRYVSGPSARAYVDPSLFSSRGVELIYANYRYPPYSRGPHRTRERLSAVDAFSWLGFADTLAFLRAHSCLALGG